MRLEKGDVQSVIELLLWLISHIHFIILSSARASFCCRKSVPISAHSVRFLRLCLRVISISRAPVFVRMYFDSSNSLLRFRINNDAFLHVLARLFSLPLL